RIGSTKAAVFPLPVIAQARMSWPATAGGMASSWIGVGRVNPNSRTPPVTSAWRQKEEKGMLSGSFLRFRRPGVGNERGIAGEAAVARGSLVERGTSSIARLGPGCRDLLENLWYCVSPPLCGPPGQGDAPASDLRIGLIDQGPSPHLAPRGRPHDNLLARRLSRG